MAVAVRLSARGIPARAAAASFPIVSTPTRAFGGWSHRVTAVYGTDPQPAPAPSTTMPVPPGVTSGNSLATPVFAGTWSIVRPSLPRVLPWAIPHGIEGITYTPAIGQPVQGQTPNTSARAMTRSGASPRVAPLASARVTNQPRPRFRWNVQGTRRG